jgi:signal transduction histidine kinase
VILDQLIAYVQLDDADRARLVALHRELQPFFPKIAERFYEAVWANPGAANVLQGPAQVERLRVTLIDWMSTGLLGPYDAKFNEKRSRIGRVHVRIGLAQQYMFTSISVVRAAYLDRIATLYSAEETILVVRAVDKLFDIELALMLRHYQLDSEEKLVNRERQMQADRIAAMQTMTAGLAHEVRNPLNAAKLQLELLERRLRKQSDDPKIIDPIGLAHHEIQRLTEMLNDFLAFARPPDLRTQEHDVVAIARHVIELERPLAERTGAELTLQDAPESAVVRIDPGKVHQVVQNLVRNGIEAAGASGHVTVSVVLETSALHIRVADDGPGIPEEIRTRVYEPFFSTKEGGTGMGMSIVHNFVAMHGGKIDIASGPRGTLIDVTIPRSRS